MKVLSLYKSPSLNFEDVAGRNLSIIRVTDLVHVVVLRAGVQLVVRTGHVLAPRVVQLGN